ncbi:MAG: hypothetical protein R2711_05770 [Acidimicrobiales bacterium]
MEGLEPIDDPLVVAAPDVHVVETHSSVLFFLDDRVYKMKKAVDLGFLDFTTVEARRERAARRWR